MSKQAFHARLADLTRQIAGRPLDEALEQWLNEHHGAGSATFEALRADCREGVREGWLCEREGGGIRYGRVFKAEDALGRFSVDVVDMRDIAGPHHTHPGGEIDLVMPMDGDAATFDGRPAGWCVYPPGSAHHPTVRRAARWCCTCCPKGRSSSPGPDSPGLELLPQTPMPPAAPGSPDHPPLHRLRAARAAARGTRRTGTRRHA